MIGFRFPSRYPLTAQKPHFLTHRRFPSLGVANRASMPAKRIYSHAGWLIGDSFLSCQPESFSVFLKDRRDRKKLGCQYNPLDEPKSRIPGSKISMLMRPFCRLKFWNADAALFPVCLKSSDKFFGLNQQDAARVCQGLISDNFRAADRF